MSFTPHTDDDTKQMLDVIGAQSIDELFDEIPNDLLAKPFNEKVIQSPLDEMSAGRFFQNIAQRDQINLSFLGAGAYEHYIPSAVWDIASRGEFLTAYTPYQAEASQGTLQVIYEYQTMIASLLGLDVSNASLYDGATALAEAVLMAIRANRHSKSKKVLIPKTVHPFYRQTVETIVKQQGIEIVEVQYDIKTGLIDSNDLTRYQQDDFAALIIPQPNFFGRLEDVDMLTDWAHARKILAVALVNPVAMALLKEPGAWGTQGADIACGEGQPLGIPLSSGGPYFGFMACRSEFVRQMPGRIVGQTVDRDNKRCFTLTLQAREQHIRRSKATSNICTNQGLLMTAATIYMSLMGYQGLKNIAQKSHHNLMTLCHLLNEKTNIQCFFPQPSFHEVVMKLSNGTSEEFLSALIKKGIQGGVSLKPFYPELGESVLICATETKTEDDLARFVNMIVELGYSKKSEIVL